MQTTAKDEDLTASTPTLACRPYYSNYVNDSKNVNHFTTAKPIDSFRAVSKQIAHNEEQLRASTKLTGRVIHKVSVADDATLLYEKIPEDEIPKEEIPKCSPCQNCAIC
jgi:hypothetical protein